jgi:hypothetical protein
MKENRVKFSLIAKNQLPRYVREEYPLISEFLSQYYISQEYQGSAADLIQNIDQYIKIENVVNKSSGATLSSDISFFDDVIYIQSETGTNGYPDSYGLIQIDEEIITYTGKTDRSFTGCIRGFSGITSYQKQNDPEYVVFSSTETSEHSAGASIINLSSLFLDNFLVKIKNQFIPGLENRTLTDNLNQSIFIKQSKDFYTSKGTDLSFEILFKSLYNENVKVVRPKEYLIRPSDANYQITKNLVVESIEGDPLELENSTLYQEEYGNFTKSYAPIALVEKILSKDGKEYFILGYDANYNRDISVDGALYGNFKVHPKTKVIGDVSSQSFIDVDSTIGFPNQGELYVIYQDGTSGVVNYESKNTTQFLNCTNITGIILDGEDISINTYASNKSKSVKVRITSVLSDIDFVDNPYYLQKDDEIQIKSLGINADARDFISNNWLFNISSSYNVKNVTLLDASNKIYKILIDSDHIFKLGDNIILIGDADTNTLGTIEDIISNNTIIIKSQSILLLSDSYKIKRKLLKFNSTKFSDISSIISNVQNVYKSEDRTLISSQSLPNYGNQLINPYDKKIIFSGFYTSGTDTFKISENSDHGFYTGDSIYYTPQIIEVTETDIDGNTFVSEEIGSSLFDEGVYFIKRVDENNIKFAKSRTDINYSNYIKLNDDKDINANKIEYIKFAAKTLKPQNILREISRPITNSSKYETPSGSCTGILINGVEISNYKSNDIVYYGKLEKINVISGGNGYDVFNPPNLSIDDEIGTGATTGNISVKGSLQKIDVIDPGFDYLSTPIITITGGNGYGAQAKVNMKLISHSVKFNSELKSANVSVGSTLSTIGFGTYHKFRNAERIIYRTNGERGVGGLSTNSDYYASIITPYSIKLHKTSSDAISGINTIFLTSYGTGNHYFESYNKKSVISSINVTNSGQGYENKLRTTTSVGINTFIDVITLKDHGYNNGEIINYTTDGVSISGLSNGSDYYVTSLDKDTIRLSSVGVGSTNIDFYYKTKQYISLNSIGSGTHKFNYPNVNVSITGNIGISSVNGSTFQAIIQPVFRGEITSVNLENNGVGYGSSDILNYKREPVIEVSVGKNAELIPIVSNGKIVEVLINNPGSEYNSPPDLIVSGQGFGAYLTAVVKNGQIKEVKIIDSGAGYVQDTTFVTIVTFGDDAKFSSEIQKWRVNLFEKNFNLFSDDDGIITESKNSEYELKYSHLYAPRKLRENLFPIGKNNKTLYGKRDLTKINNSEVNSIDHSPIIGWAYDGNPIYGPYGYQTKEGGKIVQMKSGYKEESLIKENRPSLDEFPSGFFVEDFTYYEDGDESTLDECNGRFCVTPEFPKGTYAYFATLNPLSVDSFGVFARYKRPIFPYLIGNFYSSNPIEFNFKKYSNQDRIDLNETKWSRNVFPYNLYDNNYLYLDLPNNLNQKSTIKYVSSGSIDDIKVIFGGENYKVNDNVIFNNTKGYGTEAIVSKISGKTISSVSVATSSISDVYLYPSGNKGEVVLLTNNPHSYSSGDIISVTGLSTSLFGVDGFYNASISSNILSLASTIPQSSTTGIVTYFSVSGNINSNKIRENDILLIDSERIKVLNVDTKSSRIRVLRERNNTIGSSHSSTSLIYEIPRKITIDTKKVGLNTFYPYKIDKEIYFDPKESIGIGTLSSVGMGITLVFSNPGAGITNIFIPSKSIYIPDHNLETGDELTYSTNGGSPIGVSTNGINSYNLLDQTTLYVAKINSDLIGISSVKVGIGSTGLFVGITSQTSRSSTLFFTGIGTGSSHSFKTNYNPIRAKVSRNIVTVATSQTHGLLDNDVVFMNIKSGVTTSIIVRYNDYHRLLIIDPKEFNSLDVDILNNSIFISNHTLFTGQKVLHTSSSPSGGLENNKFYYVFVIDKDNIKLCENYYNSTLLNPIFVNITSSSNGTLSQINPPINGFRNSTINFDLSDSSLSYLRGGSKYPAFDFNLFLDSEYNQKFDTTGKNTQFNFRKTGVIGIDAVISLVIDDHIPKNLYYKLTPVYSSESLPKFKEGIQIDDSVFSRNQIKIEESFYNGKHEVSVASTTSFTYPLKKYPENSQYTSSNSLSINYLTNSLSAYGPISEIKVLNGGKNYYVLPEASDIRTSSGYDAIIEPSSKTIGNTKKVRFQDIGFNFPSDFTLRPSISLPQIIKMSPSFSFESVGVSSFGRGYTYPPKLLIINSETNEIIPEADLRFSLTSNKVEIFNNTYSLRNLNPIILPIENSNGVGIGSISYNSFNKKVTIRLSVGFSTAESFPFKVNDRVLIENVSVGVATTAKGYNSKDYNYQLFTLTDVDENRGGIGSVSYSLSGLLEDSEYPGNFDILNSSARIIPEKYFPIFDIKLVENDYYIGEFVNSTSATGKVIGWDKKTNNLKVSSARGFTEGELIIGSVSKSQGIASSITSFNAFFNLSSSSRVENGWKSNVGFLNDNLQKVQDSFYYQNFSYSLRSRVDYETWNDAVSTLNHTLGFKKFSDYQLESFNENQSIVGVTTDLSGFNIVNDIISYGDLNCVYDFDLVKENSIINNSRIISDEIIFKNRILTDYSESFGNRVLSIDDISSQFNSNPRPEKYSEAFRFSIGDARAQKSIVCIRDKRYYTQLQLIVLTLLHNNTLGYINQYGRVETLEDLGYFDFTINGSEGVVLFYPTKFKTYDYDITSFSYNLKDSFVGINSTIIGNNVKIITSNSNISSGSVTTIAGIAVTHTSAKILVEISTDSDDYQFDELNVVHNGSNVEFIEYGKIINSSSGYVGSGLGTYYSYISGSNVNVDFIPDNNINASVNTIQVSFAGTSVSGVGSLPLRNAELLTDTVLISSSPTPSETVILSYSEEFDGAYCIVQAYDMTNNQNQLSEVIITDDGSVSDGYVGYSYHSEFGNIETLSGIGTIGSNKSLGITNLTFTAKQNTKVQVKVYSHLIRAERNEYLPSDDLSNAIETDYGVYFGTERDIKKSFEILHNSSPVFEKYFDASNPSIANTTTNTITLGNHFFVTGEMVTYQQDISPIGIAATYFGVGIGTTNKLPSDVYIVKVDDSSVKLARSAEDALKVIPKTIDLTSISGIGSAHKFSATKQNSKIIVAIDNVIQSPVVATSLTTTLSKELLSTQNIAYFTGITSFFGGDLIQIGSEIMKIEGVGIGSTNAIRVQRPLLGTNIAGYSTGSLITRVTGSYNIVDNVINFIDAPYGNLPDITFSNKPDDRDWSGIATGSSFQGRVFLRSGQPNGVNETYYKNYIFDDISEQFNGYSGTFPLKSNKNDITGIYNENAVILINDVFQGPSQSLNYTLSENSGITSISFVGTPSSNPYDANMGGLPRGGIIISVGSTAGLGYQPLISAGGTAIVSTSGTISQVSIGNSGSGYRSGIHTLGGIKPIEIRVGVGTSSLGTPNIEFIGTASVSNGRIVSVAITNPGYGYTSSNPPYVVFDAPVSYSNMPLYYSSSSSGVGTQARIDVVVGQGSSIIDFEITNTGYGYGQGNILTIPVGGIAGIPTTSGYDEFKIIIQKTFTDKFSGWSMGEFQVIDSIENLFDGDTITFPLKFSNSLISIRSSKGSNIVVQDTLLIFLNDILQVPGKSYIFDGGSIITFTEAPKVGDTCKILFYRGSGSVDVIDRNILETVKVGDKLTISYDPSIGQSPILSEDYRIATSINSTDILETNTYFGPGNTADENLLRPIIWCRQTEDKIINEKEIGKDRTLYEPSIYPSSYLIQSVGIGSTFIFVDNIRPFFNPINENDYSLDFQKKITIISQDNKIGSYATSVVSSGGTISSILLSSGGYGYESSPDVSIQSPVGLGDTQKANATALITSGIVTSIKISYGGIGYTSTNPPSVLIAPPTIKKESDSVQSYQGDFGIIVGISTGSFVGIASTAIVFDLFIPHDSYLRDSSITGITTLSGIQTGYYFVVSNSNVGKGVTSLDSSGSIVGVGTTYLDNIYIANSVSIASTSIPGIGMTYIRKVIARVSSYNGLSLNGIGVTNFYGEFSWGRITLSERSEENTYNAYTLKGISGITTGSIVTRYSPLKYLDYIP